MRPSSRMWTRCCPYRRNRSRPGGTNGNKSCVMEIWKTAAHADGKPIHGLWKRTGLSHRTVNRFPTATPDMAVYTHSHNAYYGAYPSDPFLSFMERKRKGQKKNVSAAHGRTVKAALPFWYFCYDFMIFLCYNKHKVVGLGLQSRGSRVV